MGERLHGIHLHLSAYHPVSDVEVLVKTSVKSIEFFMRNNLKFTFSRKKIDKPKSNAKGFISKFTGEIKKLSLANLMKKLKVKKADRFSNVKLDVISAQRDESDIENCLEVIDSTLEILKNLIEQ
jgi:hypothetical protein